MSETIASLENSWNEAQRSEAQARHDRNRKGGDTGSGNPPGGGELEARIAQLEKSIPEIREKLVRVEMRLDAIESNMATKVDLAVLASKDDLNGYVRASGKDIQDLAVSFQKSITDIQKTINDQTWKFISIAGVLAGLAFTAAKFIQP